MCIPKSHIFWSFLTLIIGVSSSYAQSMPIGYWNGSMYQERDWGLLKPDTYDIAIILDDAELLGCTITSISFPLYSPSASNLSVWLSDELKVENVDGRKVNSPTILSENIDSFLPGWQNINLTQPYKIEKLPIYVGASFTINNKEAEEDRRPLQLGFNFDQRGFMLHSVKTYQNWTNMVDRSTGNLMIEASIAGPQIGTNAAQPIEQGLIYRSIEQDTKAWITLKNHGVEPINDINYRYQIDGNTLLGSYQFASPIPAYFGAMDIFPISLPSAEMATISDLNLEITSVNDKANNDLWPTCSYKIQSLNTYPHKRVAIEEFTGLWCGGCPVAYVALQLLNESFGDDIVIMSYHYNDPMQFTKDWPLDVKSYPEFYIDRQIKTSAYWGDLIKEKRYYSYVYVQDKLREFSPVAVDVELEWLGDDYSQLMVNGEAKFSFDFEEHDFGVYLVLIHDGLTGDFDDPTWWQHNYQTGQTDWVDDYMGIFLTDGEWIPGLIYDDVAVAYSGTSPLQDCLPDKIKADTTYPINYIFNLNDVKNLQGNPIIQNIDNLRVALLITNNTSNAIVNIVQTAVPASENSISEITNDRCINVRWFNLQGRLITQPLEPGIYLRQRIFDNNKSCTDKVLIK